MGRKKIELTPEQVERNCAILDLLMERYDLRNDRMLAEFLHVLAPAISKIRHGRTGISPWLTLMIHEVSDLSVADIRRLLAPAQPQ